LLFVFGLKFRIETRFNSQQVGIKTPLAFVL
jgi:hypothetical protein